MIKLENTEVFNFEGAIRGMRNPMDSWHKSDSEWKAVEVEEGVALKYCLGENDLALARKLATARSDHRKFLRQIMVSVDITAPLYWWKEFDTYKVGTVANSCSTMHTIHKRDLTLDDFSCEHLCNDFMYVHDGLDSREERINSQLLLKEVINVLNTLRIFYWQTKDKKYWYQMIQLLPSSYNQKRTVTLNYEVLLNQYHARKQHKLSEWLDYCEWIKALPYFEEICL